MTATEPTSCPAPTPSCRLPGPLQPVVPAYTITPQDLARHGLRQHPGTSGRHGHRTLSQCGPGLFAQGGRLLHHGQASVQVRLQLQPLHQEPDALRRCAGQLRLGQVVERQLMDMLMGLPSSYSQNQAAPIRHYANQTPSVYAHGQLARYPPPELADRPPL